MILPGHQFEVSGRLPDKTCHTDTRMPTAGGWSAVVGFGGEGSGGTDGVISGFDTDARGNKASFDFAAELAEAILDGAPPLPREVLRIHVGGISRQTVGSTWDNNGWPDGWVNVGQLAIRLRTNNLRAIDYAFSFNR